MTNEEKYIFQSTRLGFRNWKEEDKPAFIELNADHDVMKHFPSILTNDETLDLWNRLYRHYNERGYTYFAVEELATGAFIGFIGLAYQTYNTEFTPATDIGWRLKKSAWGKGYATEGAKRCLKYAREQLKLDRIIAVCTMQNEKSEKVMQKIGLKRMGVFTHPLLKNEPDYETCLWYEIKW